MPGTLHRNEYVLATLLKNSRQSVQKKLRAASSHGASLFFSFLSIQSGLSPLAPGQWKGFLAIYAGFFAFLNIIRPARFALSVYLSRYFERAIQLAQERFHCNKATAVGLVVFFLNFCGSLTLITVGIFLASALSGVPVWAGRV